MNICVSVDIQNLYYNLYKKYKSKLDYQKYLSACKTDNEHLHRAYAYGGNPDDSVKFMDCLRHIGYDVKFGQRYWNIEMTIDIFKVIDKIDIVIIGSNDVALIPLVDYLRDKGIKVIVFACNVGRVLAYHCDEVIEIEATLMETKDALIKAPGDD